MLSFCLPYRHATLKEGSFTGKHGCKICLKEISGWQHVINRRNPPEITCYRQNQSLQETTVTKSKPQSNFCGMHIWKLINKSNLKNTSAIQVRLQPNMAKEQRDCELHGFDMKNLVESPSSSWLYQSEDREGFRMLRLALMLYMTWAASWSSVSVIW